MDGCKRCSIKLHVSSNRFINKFKRTSYRSAGERILTSRHLTALEKRGKEKSRRLVSGYSWASSPLAIPRIALIGWNFEKGGSLPLCSWDFKFD